MNELNEKLNDESKRTTQLLHDIHHLNQENIKKRKELETQIQENNNDYANIEQQLYMANNQSQTLERQLQKITKENQEYIDELDTLKNQFKKIETNNTESMSEQVMSFYFFCFLFFCFVLFFKSKRDLQRKRSSFVLKISWVCLSIVNIYPCYLIHA